MIFKKRYEDKKYNTEMIIQLFKDFFNILFSGKIL
jgi:hypothetical protein